MDYREHSAPAHLAPWVECVWTLRGAVAGPQRILPDGCAEIILHYGEPMREHGVPQPRCLAVGQIDEFLLLDATGLVNVAGIRFQPEGAHGFFRARMHELTNRQLDLDTVAGAALRRRLEETEGDPAAIWQVLEERLRGVAAPDPMLVRAIRMARETPVDEIAERLGTGTRQLHRTFHEQVGIPAKRFGQILRFQQVLTAWESADMVRLADLAIDCGFYDQAHMCREFARFCGKSPSAFFQHPEVLARLFSRANRTSDLSKPPL
jgi:AraC-like DNA-binding protein